MSFPVAQMVRNPPAMQETWIQSLAWEDPLEKGKATHSSILACRIRKESDTTERLSLSLSDWCEVIPQCGFDLHFYNTSQR